MPLHGSIYKRGEVVRTWRLRDFALEDGRGAGSQIGATETERGLVSPSETERDTDPLPGTEARTDRQGPGDGTPAAGAERGSEGLGASAGHSATPVPPTLAYAKPASSATAGRPRIGVGRSLRGARADLDPSGEGRFRIVFRDGQAYELLARSAAEARDWVAAVRVAVLRDNRAVARAGVRRGEGGGGSRAGEGGSEGSVGGPEDPGAEPPGAAPAAPGAGARTGDTTPEALPLSPPTLSPRSQGSADAAGAPTPALAAAPDAQSSPETSGFSTPRLSALSPQASGSATPVPGGILASLGAQGVLGTRQPSHILQSLGHANATLRSLLGRVGGGVTDEGGDSPGAGPGPPREGGAEGPDERPGRDARRGGASRLAGRPLAGQGPPPAVGPPDPGARTASERLAAPLPAELRDPRPRLSPSLAALAIEEQFERARRYFAEEGGSFPLEHRETLTAWEEQACAHPPPGDEAEAEGPLQSPGSSSLAAKAAFCLALNAVAPRWAAWGPGDTAHSSPDVLAATARVRPGAETLLDIAVAAGFASPEWVRLFLAHGGLGALLGALSRSLTILDECSKSEPSAAATAHGRRAVPVGGSSADSPAARPPVADAALPAGAQARLALPTSPPDPVTLATAAAERRESSAVAFPSEPSSPSESLARASPVSASSPPRSHPIGRRPPVAATRPSGGEGGGASPPSATAAAAEVAAAALTALTALSSREVGLEACLRRSGFLHLLTLSLRPDATEAAGVTLALLAHVAVGSAQRRADVLVALAEGGGEPGGGSRATSPPSGAAGWVGGPATPAPGQAGDPTSDLLPPRAPAWRRDGVASVLVELLAPRLLESPTKREPGARARRAVAFNDGAHELQELEGEMGATPTTYSAAERNAAERCLQLLSVLVRGETNEGRGAEGEGAEGGGSGGGSVGGGDGGGALSPSPAPADPVSRGEPDARAPSPTPKTPGAPASPLLRRFAARLTRSGLLPALSALREGQAGFVRREVDALKEAVYDLVVGGESEGALFGLGGAEGGAEGGTEGGAEGGAHGATAPPNGAAEARDAVKDSGGEAALPAPEARDPRESPAAPAPAPSVKLLATHTAAGLARPASPPVGVGRACGSPQPPGGPPALPEAGGGPDDPQPPPSGEGRTAGAARPEATAGATALAPAAAAADAAAARGPRASREPPGPRPAPPPAAPSGAAAPLKTSLRSTTFSPTPKPGRIKLPAFLREQEEDGELSAPTFSGPLQKAAPALGRRAGAPALPPGGLPKEPSRDLAVAPRPRPASPGDAPSARSPSPAGGGPA